MNKNELKLCMGCMAPKENEGVCVHCGFNDTVAFDVDFLPPGTALDARYVVGALKNKNGEGATYIGYDQDEKTPVWIREYFPKTLATRNPDTGEVISKNGCDAQYKALLSDFIELCNEVRRLSISDPVIPVENMVGENNTIYVIYKYLNVMPLEEYLVARGGNLTAEDAIDLFLPLLNGMDNIHIRGIIHRGLSPYTIYADEKGQLYIGDFTLSATRTGGSELQAELFNGYSAPEQYVSTGWQGTWTDVYALATIFYRAISGVVPPKSTRISKENPLPPLKKIVANIPARISDAIEVAMSTAPQDRTQTVASFLSALLAEEGTVNTAVFDPGRFPVVLPDVKVSKEDIKFGHEAGYTEDISTPEELEIFRAEMRKNMENNSMPNNNPQEEYPEYREELQDDYIYEEDPGPRKKKSGGFIGILIIVIVVILVGAVLAIMVNKKINPPKKEDPTANGIITSSSTSELKDPSETTSTEEDKDLVPDFVGKKWSSVEHNSDYTDKYTFSTKEEFDAKASKGTIIKQNPEKDTKLEKGKIELVISKGPHTMKMPDLSGKDFEQAKQELGRLAEELDISIDDMKITKMERYKEDAEEDKIISTSPEAGEEFDPKKEWIEIHVAMKAPEASSSVEAPPSSQQSRPVIIIDDDEDYIRRNDQGERLDGPIRFN